MNKPIKVAHVLLSLGVGGMEKVIVDIIGRFDRSKVDSVVLCTGRKGDFGLMLENRGIKVGIVDCKKYPFSRAMTFSKIFRDEKIDIVHSYSGVYRDAALGAFLGGIPINIHTDQGKFYPDSRWTRINHRIFSHLRDRVVAVSDELRSFLINEVKIPSKKVMRIYNGVDTLDHVGNIDIDKKKKEIGIKPGDKIIGIVARFVPVKDHKTLLHAFKKVREKISNAKLLMVGYGTLHNELEEETRRIGESDNVMFLGKRSDVKELLPLMDVVCLSSLSEGLSLTLAEAMASGKPVVATNVGGNPELIEDGVSGLLVPPKDADKMADAIIRLLSNDKLRQDMGAAARIRVKERFDINGIVKEYENLYFELAKKKGLLNVQE